MNGILLVDKEQNWTSSDVVVKLKGILRQRRVGHAGTLDPMATGLLVVFAGRATRAVEFAERDSKRYLASLRLGTVTDTQDIWGTVLEKNAADVGRDELEAALERFRGAQQQLPPMYSAVKVGGKKLYELARQGKTVERTPRRVRIDKLELTAFDPETGAGTLCMTCGSGTYVRTVIDDLGRVLGCGAVMTSLRRTLSNNFRIERCVTIEQVQALADAGNAGSAIIPIAEVFQVLPPLRLNEKQTRLYRNGVKLELRQIEKQLLAGDRFAVYGTPDGFLGTAITDRENGILRIERNLTEPKEQAND